MAGSCYTDGYNELLSQVSREFQRRFAAMASPTLSKQETVTALHQSIVAGIASGQARPPFPWRPLTWFLPRLMWMFVKIGYLSVRFRVRFIPSDAVIFRTWLVPRSVTTSRLVDDFFRELPEHLSAFENIVISYNSTDVGLLTKFGKIQKAENQVVGYGFLTLVDVVSLFLSFTFTALIQARKRYQLGGVDVTVYINRSLLLDYLGLRSFEAYAEWFKCERLVKLKIKAFVYVFENQSWEKVCCASLRGRNIRLIAYQSSGFSPIFLNFFPTEEDARRQPMPDVILTVGDHFRRYLVEHGHYAVPVKTFAALRFSYPSTDGKYLVQVPNPCIVGRILYAFPVHIEQYAEIINDLIGVFRDSGIAVDLKLHPLYRLADAKVVSELPNNFRIVTQVDMAGLRNTYDCVLFNDNSFGIEALLQGVRSYQYSRDGSFADDRFMYFRLWPVNYGLGDIKALKQALQSGEYEKAFDVEAVAEYVNGMYRPYTRTVVGQFREALDGAHAA